MQKFQWRKLLQSGPGRALAGAFIGGLLIAFSGVDEPAWFLGGMAAGALLLYLLGRWE